MNVPEAMRKEVVWYQGRWATKTEQEWFEMCSRLLSPPETNFRFWDYIEGDELGAYVTRGEQVKDAYRDHPYLPQNVANAARALEYFHHEICSRWRILPGLEGVIGLKEAIRRKQAIDVHGSCMHDPLLIKETMERCVSEMDLSMKLDEDPTCITKADWDRLMEEGPTPILEQSLRRCAQEIDRSSKNKE
jgi:hypothetical protein